MIFELKKADKYFTDFENEGPKIYAQYIIGIHDNVDALLKIIDVLQEERIIDLTLLGFKNTGRGLKFKNVNIEEEMFHAIINKVRDEHLWINIGVDTALANKWKGILCEEGISRIFYTTKEGVNSCYIDAVTGVMSPSSYDDNIVKLDSYNTDELTKTFKSFHGGEE